MKIFNTENGVQKVYVQIDDIMMLKKIEESTLDPISDVNNNNKMDFIEFTKPNEIKYFKSLDWIVDYKQVRQLSEEEYRIKSKELSTEIHDICNKLHDMSNNDKNNDRSLLIRYELLKHKIKAFNEIQLIKQGRLQISFPIVPDSDGFSFNSNDSCAYEIRDSLDPNKLLLFKKYGNKLSDSDRVPESFVQTGMAIAVMTRYPKDTFIGSYQMTRYITEDNQYLVTEFKVESYEKDTVEQKGIKKLFKRIFSKKNERY